ncbi:MAG: phosphatase PAP2 family protein [Acidobacteriota bacterium]
MKTFRKFFLIVPLVLFGFATVSFPEATDTQTASSPAQDSPPAIVKLSPTPTPSPTPKANFFKDVAHDQKTIWLSPFHLKREDVKWLAPLAFTTAALIATDRKTSAWVDLNGTLPTASRRVSFAGSTYITGGAVAGFYLIGRATHDRRAQETGELAAEALLDTAIVTEVLKFAAGRARPNEGNGNGHFFRGGSSFPSGHSSSAWAVATVIAYKYKDHPFIKYGAFAIAAAISMSRYSGRNHFLGDVVVGSAIGFGIGRYVYSTHR